jgi:ectoine hydroxylase-related dioxygenase (phytanoyl-CoA dioxygenase family)
VFVPVGSSAQEWHADDSMRKLKVHRYFTILIHLNPLDNQCGGTEVWSHQTNKSDMVRLHVCGLCFILTTVLSLSFSLSLSMYVQIRARPGDALVFNGSLLHRGQANNGFTHRFFYYASFACGSDMNVGMM